MAIAISRLSTPAAALTFATQRLARTGVYTLDKQFRDNVRNFQGVYVEKNDEIVEQNPGLLSGQGMPGQMIDASDAYPDLTLLKKEPLNESINGILQDTKVVHSSALWYNNPWDFIIGGCRWGGGGSHDINTFYHCKLDDITILNTPLSSSWISTEYANQNDQSNFLSIGLEEGA